MCAMEWTEGEQMTEAEILQEIKDTGCENAVLRVLLQDRLSYIDDLENENSGLNASITAIRKINQGKDEAIDALCEPEDERVRRKRWAK